MRIILSRMPALDAALARFDAWWSGLSSRERWLVGTMATLLALVILVYGIIKPLQSARAEAISDIRTYETLTARVRAAGTLTTAKPPQRQGLPVRIATDSASAVGLAITPEAIAGGARVTVSDTSYETLTAWLADLSATSTLRVRRLSIDRTAVAGRVSASLDLVQ
ncbi:type II secretion system protein GspM [Sphingomonas sp. MMS12-HWE2-04]|uniref:type II secretion system protein GspM n=1 Tax=Sphingomonas sp. MMS12-HWE2-04 TaxID=3234199 RepID=UPI00384C1429